MAASPWLKETGYGAPAKAAIKRARLSRAFAHGPQDAEAIRQSNTVAW